MPTVEWSGDIPRSIAFEADEAASLISLIDDIALLQKLVERRAGSSFREFTSQESAYILSAIKQFAVLVE